MNRIDAKTPRKKETPVNATSVAVSPDRLRLLMPGRIYELRPGRIMPEDGAPLITRLAAHTLK